MPRRPTIIIFRHFPARAQAYLAETLQEEGWFDDQGWFIKDWFRDIEQPELGLLVGDQIKYHSGLAWAKAADRYREYGRENGLYLDPDARRKLITDAKVFQKYASIKTAERAAPPPRSAPQDVKDGFFAHEKLHWNGVYKNMTNYDGLLYESEAKSLPQAVAALKLFHMADAWRKKAPPVTMLYYERNELTNQYEPKTAPLLSVYDRAQELWLDVLLSSPNVRKISNTQEETYELQLKFIRYFQDEKVEPLLRPIMKAMPLALPNSPGLGHAHELYELGKERWTRLRDFRGPFDMVYTIEGLEPEVEQEVKSKLLLWSTGGKSFLALHPSLQPFQLSFVHPRHAPLAAGWVPLIAPDAVMTVRNRYRGLQVAPQMAEPADTTPPGGAP
jgi:hypothetical protein